MSDLLPKHRCSGCAERMDLSLLSIVIGARAAAVLCGPCILRVLTPGAVKLPNQGPTVEAPEPWSPTPAADPEIAAAHVVGRSPEPIRGPAEGRRNGPPHRRGTTASSGLAAPVSRADLLCPVGMCIRSFATQARLDRHLNHDHPTYQEAS